MPKILKNIIYDDNNDDNNDNDDNDNNDSKWIVSDKNNENYSIHAHFKKNE